MDRDTWREIQRIRQETQKWQDDHMQMHKDEAAARQSEHRWLVSGVIIPTLAVLVSAGGILAALLISGH